jgi:2-polyprenyl-3-methyl-5-hydroxy-6-metoxy-1,4-benzoquinol methylase
VKNDNRYNLNYIYYDGIKIPKLTKKMDLITINHVLHHIRDVENIIKQLGNLCADGGYILIKEHESEDNIRAKIIDIEHSIYEIVFDGANRNFLLNYFARYFCHPELIILFLLHGYTFIPIKEDNYDDPTKPKMYLFQK